MRAYGLSGKKEAIYHKARFLCQKALGRETGAHERGGIFPPSDILARWDYSIADQA
jgi:hypothetical protein